MLLFSQTCGLRVFGLCWIQKSDAFNRIFNETHQRKGSKELSLLNGVRRER